MLMFLKLLCVYKSPVNLIKISVLWDLRSTEMQSVDMRCTREIWSHSMDFMSVNWGTLLVLWHICQLLEHSEIQYQIFFFNLSWFSCILSSSIYLWVWCVGLQMDWHDCRNLGRIFSSFPYQRRHGESQDS